LDTLNLDVHY